MLYAVALSTLSQVILINWLVIVVILMLVGVLSFSAGSIHEIMIFVSVVVSVVGVCENVIYFLK